jgi:hypothetical protein
MVMFCDRCGASLQNQQRFCDACGKPVGVVPLMPVQSRIAGHIRLLAIFWIAISAFRLLPGVFLGAFFRRGMPWFHDYGMPGFFFPMMHALSLLLLGTAVLGIVTGCGLLERRPWARMLAIVLGCIFLVDMPFGTALGIYTLWVLLPAASEEEYRQISRVA